MDMHLHDITKNLESDTIRKGFGEGLKKLGETDDKVVALCADLTGSTNMNFFADVFPDRFFQVGIAEQNLVTVGSGLAAVGFIPFVSSYAAFSPGRNWEQIRTTVCLNNQPVKIIGSHAGLSVGPDGATHQMLEDIALMRSLPNMVVIVPCDKNEAYKATLALGADKRPGYLRLAREPVPIITSDETPFEIGKAYVYDEGRDLTVISTGTMTYLALKVASNLYKDGIDVEVIHCPTIKPLDSETILKSVKKTGAVITCEEAQINGGLGGAIAELLGENHPVPLRRIGVEDRFGESGDPEELFEHFGLTTKHIEKTAHDLMKQLGRT
ncbi:MAG: transketolase family protein [Patescibacteria group bacterium]